ncbi:META domain-containing protein [Sphingosinicella sp. LHD-64]|uniref:META domain-containing protein n=1 Tax=Sphingosinicella sp. LHD-64 TaxID=3072139 RepID=UPI0028105F07|nr:META domain-containing protein [Sphingosinicella sp. LHD-64]MDQ8755026.1 META domain-containing protein [Sphingosinicella sp. LHD-64]
MKAILIAGLAALAACATPAENNQIGEDAYRALGTEPFWSVTIADGQMRYETPDSRDLIVPAPEPRTSFNGHRYETERLTVDVTHQPCSDGMSDRRYADTVRVTADGRELSGCGGEILPPASLADTSWSLVAIGGEAVSGERYAMQFTADRVSGQAGCNRFGGSYALAGETLTPGPIMSTRMACPEPAMTHEGRVLAVLRGPVTVSFPDGDTMVLAGNGGEIRLRRAI